MSESSDLPSSGNPTKAVRLVFSFDGEHVTLVSQQPVEMVLPPSDPLTGTEGRKGFWCELRDAQDRPLYRKVMHDPMREDVEVFSDDPQQPGVARHVVPNRKGMFVVLVPDTADGCTAILSSSPRRLAVAHQPATVIARFDLISRNRADPAQRDDQSQSGHDQMARPHPARDADAHDDQCRLLEVRPPAQPGRDRYGRRF